MTTNNDPKMDEAVVYAAANQKAKIAPIARLFDVNSRTLLRRVRGISRSKADGHVQSQGLLSLNQEKLLVQWIKNLTEWLIPPTPGDVADKAGVMANQRPGHNWVSGFLERHKAELRGKWLQGLTTSRAVADLNIEAYQKWYDQVDLPIFRRFKLISL
jgi:hypothetical protein